MDFIPVVRLVGLGPTLKAAWTGNKKTRIWIRGGFREGSVWVFSLRSMASDIRVQDLFLDGGMILFGAAADGCV